MNKLMYEKKANMVVELNPTISKYVNNVSKIRYEVYEGVLGGIYEFLRVDYVGGGYSVKNCSGNSHSAIIKAMGDLLDGGYYDQVEWYESIKDDEWKYKRII